MADQKELTSESHSREMSEVRPSADSSVSGETKHLSLETSAPAPITVSDSSSTDPSDGVDSSSENPNQSLPYIKQEIRKLPERTRSASSVRSIPVPETIHESAESSTASSEADHKKDDHDDNMSDVATADGDLKGLTIEDTNDSDSGEENEQKAQVEDKAQITSETKLPATAAANLTPASSNDEDSKAKDSSKHPIQSITSSQDVIEPRTKPQTPPSEPSQTNQVAASAKQQVNYAENPSKPSRFKVVPRAPQRGPDPQQPTKQKTSPNKPNHVNAAKPSRFKIIPQGSQPASTGNELSVNANGSSLASNSASPNESINASVSKQEIPPSNISVPRTLPPSGIAPNGQTQTQQLPQHHQHASVLSDSASLGSAPSAVDSLGVPAYQSHHSVQGGLPIGHPQPGLVQAPLQQTGQGAGVDQQVLVALPYQQQSHPQHQTMIYQLPGVVTVPVNTNGQVGFSPLSTPVGTAPPIPQGDAQSLPETLQQPGLNQQHPNAPDQVYRTIGAMPVVKLQGVTTNFVKKRKGRFKFLHPAAVSGDPVAVDPSQSVPASAGSATPVLQGNRQQPQGTNSSTISTKVPGQSTISTISATTSQGPQPAEPLSNVPAVKKKGRFVVTNVNDSSTAAPALTQPQQISSQMPNVPDGSSNLPSKVSNQQQQDGNQVLSGGRLSSQNSTEVKQPQQINNADPHATVSQNIPRNIEVSYQQPVALYTTQSTIPVAQHQTYLNPVGPQYFAVEPALDQGPSYLVSTQGQGNAFDPSPTQHPAQSLTPPPTPGTHDSRNSSPQISHQLSVALPPIPMPKATQTQDGEKTKAGAGTSSIAQTTKRKTAAPPRAAKPGQGMDKSSPGLGKVFYFLDQMKAEVTDADQKIKTLQTDMKFLVSPTSSSEGDRQ